ncbi:hypothetical protein GQ43DRAFT_441861 [Delitschia confertaspora ATCC 74209]|uniref:HCNGP-like protein n=1 Tax=Delitschia confertaspora ATCC 74209 TaxID=1513339 RepID=A0A9P4JIM8_9PLEO|nr:hypothetical protein GQ43DRAFT_441861 [Delitschia confertaspora ATCC 74209]
MLGINYESSDEEEQVVAAKHHLTKQPQGDDVKQPLRRSGDSRLTEPASMDAKSVPAVGLVKAPEESSKVTVREVTKGASAPAIGPPQGPPQGPSLGPLSETFQEPVEDSPVSEPIYATARERIHGLTYPLDRSHSIPPSPPGSPVPGSTAKFTQFLDLKKKGMHFNGKLQENFMFQNPGYLQNSLKKLGLTQEDEYISTLPPSTAVPRTFPDYAYVDRLADSQNRIQKERESALKAQRTAVEFVSATAGSGGELGGTQQLKGGRRQQSIAERVLGDRA